MTNSANQSSGSASAGSRKFSVTGMHCAACSMRVERAVKKTPGVTACAVSLLTNEMSDTSVLDGFDKKVKDYMHKKYQESLRENTYYSGALRVFLKYGVDEITDYEQVLDSITAADVAAAVRDILAQGNQAKVIMYGTEE